MRQLLIVAMVAISMMLVNSADGKRIKKMIGDEIVQHEICIKGIHNVDGIGYRLTSVNGGTRKEVDYIGEKDLESLINSEEGFCLTIQGNYKSSIVPYLKYSHILGIYFFAKDATKPILYNIQENVSMTDFLHDDNSLHHLFNRQSRYNVKTTDGTSVLIADCLDVKVLDQEQGDRMTKEVKQGVMDYSVFEDFTFFPFHETK